MSETESADPQQPRRLTIEERSEVLARAMHRASISGWRVTSQTTTKAQLVSGRRVNHVLHLLLTIVTFGLWAIVWIIVAATGGEKDQFISVDEYGNVSPMNFAVAPRVSAELSLADRSATLAHVIADLGRRGWTVESQTQAVLRKPKFGRWGNDHHRVSIDEHGELRYG